MEEVDDGSAGGAARRDNNNNHHDTMTAEVSSENSGAVVRLFKESPHPDEKQRQQLSKRLGLSPRQVKFWFQNRRTQIKAIQERHENTLLKAEMEKLREENKAMREISKKKIGCPNCGTADATQDDIVFTTTEQLRIKNAKLKAEVEKLRAALGKYPQAAASPSTYSSGNEQETTNRSCLDFYTGIFGLEKSRIMEKVDEAVEELKTMAGAGDPLWVRSVETGREILNYDEYLKTFRFNNNNSNTRNCLKTHIEASRETALVFMEPSRLVQSFMDENQWKEMFPFMISKAATVDVICNGEAANWNNGAVQLMFAEVQMLTPLVPTREMYFIRHCKQLDAEQWAIVDVSIENVEDNNIDASLVKYRKRPSGCIIKDESNGHCKVTMVEHLECEKNKVHNLYRSIVNSGTAFGARHWMATLQLQCERFAFFMATNIPMKDSTGVSTLAGRKSTLKLAQRMSCSFSQAVAASSYQTWTKVVGKTGEDIRVSSRKNLSDPGEPIGVILCAVSSLWLPLSPHLLFDFFRDESRRSQWDAMFGGDKAKTIANLAKGQDRGNSVTIQTIGSKENNNNNMWILQDSSTNSSESMVVYSGVDVTSMQSVMSGCDSGSVTILPSGFSILPDGADSRPPLLITRRKDDKTSDTHGGALLTAAVQILTDTSPAAKPTLESVEYVKSIICCTLKNIRTSMCCEED
ncbi:multicellular trichome development class IV homeodomain-leucine zipper transcription factor [Cucumis melo var. makuwa]|uniref:Multicellular trichome development class IV homeodomain-leucine zipper transcription factor n=1 Tax=Cucumis melo var. makuwa TaxID=1194695 RepID=A0A5A7U6J7_CUCMM|nr:multicellular trichome development class IV homeodomain-leucine zipper transcription factor [Cucumis melo var. makuwa]